MPAPTDATSFLDAVKYRRTYYALAPSSPVPYARLKQIIDQVVISTPSAFNGQGNRLIVLLGDAHKKFWAFVWNSVKSHVEGTDKEKGTRARLDGFANAYGTALVLVDPAPARELAAKFKNYADKFPQWEEHSSGMLQYALWTALEAEGFGCNLQHYNPIVDVQAKVEWNIPSEWDIKAQLVFGELKEGEKRKGWTEGKEVKPVEETVFVHGAEQ